MKNLVFLQYSAWKLCRHPRVDHRTCKTCTDQWIFDEVTTGKTLFCDLVPRNSSKDDSLNKVFKKMVICISMITCQYLALTNAQSYRVSLKQFGCKSWWYDDVLSVILYHHFMDFYPGSCTMTEGKAISPWHWHRQLKWW